MDKFFYGHVFSFLLHIFLGVALLDHTVTLCLTFWGTARLFSTENASFSIATSSVLGFQFLHILINAFYYLCFLIAILVSMKWYLIVALSCIYLMVKMSAHLFMGLLAFFTLPLAGSHDLTLTLSWAYWLSSCPRTICWKDYSFSHSVALAPLSKTDFL